MYCPTVRGQCRHPHHFTLAACTDAKLLAGPPLPWSHAVAGVDGGAAERAVQEMEAAGAVLMSGRDVLTEAAEAVTVAAQEGEGKSRSDAAAGQQQAAGAEE